MGTSREVSGFTPWHDSATMASRDGCGADRPTPFGDFYVALQAQVIFWGAVLGDFPSLGFICSSTLGGTTSRPPKWIKPQLTRLVDEAPAGSGWLYDIKYDGYRMHARIDDGDIKLLTRTGLDWSHRYRRTIEALASLKEKSAYLDGELCALDF
jgi:hypothetical protein